MPPTRPSQSHSQHNQTLSAKIRQFVVDRFNYFTVHALYFVMLSFVGAGILYACERVKKDDPAFIDCLYMAVSALCVTGLVCVDFSQYEESSQVVIFFLVLLGGQVFMSVVPVMIRRTYFDQAIEEQTATLENETIREQCRHMPEREALRLVIKISMCIFFLAILTSMVILGLYFQFVPSRKALLDKHGVNPWWFALFTSVSAFNNCGLVQLPDNLIQLKDDYFTLGVIMILTLIGNTGYPVLFRFVAYLCHRNKPNCHARKYLLEHPRRVYTLMFPALHTRILMLCIFGFTTAEFICFLSLDFNKGYFLQFTPATRALIGIFQAISTRSTGFNTIDMSEIAPAMSFLIIVLMYISAMPIIAGLRNATSQRAEQGDDCDDEAVEAIEGKPQQPVSGSVAGQVAGVLQKNGLTVFVCLFILCVSESDSLEFVIPPGDVSRKPRWGIFALIYEVASAYGNVGLTLGIPGYVPALSGFFTVVGKLVIIFLMLVGRHRSLPSSVDRAVSLEKLLAKSKGRSSFTEGNPENQSTIYVRPVRDYRKYRLTESLDRMLEGTWGAGHTTIGGSPRARMNANTFTDPEAMRLVASNSQRQNEAQPNPELNYQEAVRTSRKLRLTESLDRMLSGTWGAPEADNTRTRVGANTFTDPEAVRTPSTYRLASSGSGAGLRSSPRPGGMSMYGPPPPFITLSRIPSELEVSEDGISTNSSSGPSSVTSSVSDSQYSTSKYGPPRIP